MWGSDALLLGEDLCVSDISPACGLPCQEYGSLLDRVSAPLTHLLVSPSLYLLLWKIFSSSLQVIVRDSCSVSSCVFCVTLEGNDLRSSYFAILISTVY